MDRNLRISLSPSLVSGLVFLAALLGAAVPTHVQAGASDGRAERATRLFRAMLIADTEIDRKADPEGVLHLVFVHAGDGDRAKALGELTAARDEQRVPEPIKGLAVRIEVLKADDLAALQKRSFAGLFVAEPLRRDSIAALVQIGIERHVIVYSPFEGDLERGVSGGLWIGAQVQPMINLQALRASQVTLRDFFLKAAKTFP